MPINLTHHFAPDVATRLGQYEIKLSSFQRLLDKDDAEIEDIETEIPDWRPPLAEKKSLLGRLNILLP